MATHSSVLAWRIPGTGGAWWAAVYGVAQSRTRLKRLSSSSSSNRRSKVDECICEICTKVSKCIEKDLDESMPIPTIVMSCNGIRCDKISLCYLEFFWQACIAFVIKAINVCYAVLCHSAMGSLWDPTDWSQPGSSVHGDSPGKNTGLVCHALLQGIFPTQGLNPGLPHCRRILYEPSYQEACKCICILNSNKQFLHHIGDSQRVGGRQWIYIFLLERKN